MKYTSDPFYARDHFLKCFQRKRVDQKMSSHFDTLPLTRDTQPL
jgi:hypothetical protein